MLEVTKRTTTYKKVCCVVRETGDQWPALGPHLDTYSTTIEATTLGDRFTGFLCNGYKLDVIVEGFAPAPSNDCDAYDTFNGFDECKNDYNPYE